MDWSSYKLSLVRRGEILFSCDFFDGRSPEVEMMNKDKKGKPFTFPSIFILVINYIRYSFHLPPRQPDGIINGIGKKMLTSSSRCGNICMSIIYSTSTLKKGWKIMIAL